MKNTDLYYLVPLINKWLDYRTHHQTSLSLKTFIKNELGEDWLNRIHSKCVRIDSTITKNQISKRIADIQVLYQFLDSNHTVNYDN